MLKEKDIILAKEKFMKAHPYFDSRRFIIDEIDNPIIKVTNYDNQEQTYIGWFDESDFFIFNDLNINNDIEESLKRYEFKSFQGVTVEGKIIQFDLPVPFVKK